MKLLRDLEQAGYLTATNVKQLGHYAKKWKVSTYESLLQTHILTEHSLADAIADAYKLERAFTFDFESVDAAILAKVPFQKAVFYQCLAPHCDDKGCYLVYLLNPEDSELMVFLNKELRNFRVVILDKFLMQKSIEDIYPLHMQLPSLNHLT